MLQARELPFFEEAGACGACGAKGLDQDAPWFDFQSYLQFKVLSSELQPTPAQIPRCAPPPALP